jgi:hypothetical protein
MTIRYANGKTIQGIVLSQYRGSIRVAVEGCEDVVGFTAGNGTWLSEDRTPVRLEFAWERQLISAPVSEADCICPKELASLIVELLRKDSQADAAEHHRPEVLSMSAFC